MKKILTICYLLATSVTYAQVGIGTTTPDPKAALDISATNKGLLIPRMDSVTRVGIVTPPDGLMVFQIDGRKGFWYCIGGGWLYIADKTNSGDNLGNHTATQSLNIQNQLLVGADVLNGTPGTIGLKINGLGQVGIGAINPAQLLQVGSPTYTKPAFMRMGAGNGTAQRQWELGVNVNPANLGDVTGENYSFTIRDATANTTRLMIDYRNGYVGLGTNIPAALLDVAGTIKATSLTGDEASINGDVMLQGNRFLTVRGSNNFTGTLAGNSAVTGSYNTATGNNALASNVTGSWNTALGHSALTSVNNGYSNTGVGFQALLANTNGSYNTASGVLSLGATTAGIGNAAMGVAAINNMISGSYNSALGYFAGSNLAGGNYNTYLGSYADGPSAASITNATAIGYNAAVTASNTMRVGNTAITSIGGQVNWTAFSDGRFKKNVQENVPGLDFINKLRAVTYNLDVNGIDNSMRQAFAASKNGSEVLGIKREVTAEELQAKQEKAKIKYTGFIAQEVEEAANQLNYDFSGVDAPKTNNDFYGLRYGDFVVPLVKAVQELSKENKELKELLTRIQKQLDNLTKNAGVN